MAPAQTRLQLGQILVPADRLRKVDDNKALIIGRSMASNGQIQPIVVRPTPAAARPYTLVDGETRYRGSELNGLREIDVVITKLNGAQARLVEIEANLVRDELDKLERALAIAEYRRLWEQAHGEIRRGNPAFANSRNLRELDGAPQTAAFYTTALEKFDLSEDTIERAVTIATGLKGDLVEQLSNTRYANNQSLLLKLAELGAEKQSAIAEWMASGQDADTIIHEALYGKNHTQAHLPLNLKRQRRAIDNLGRQDEAGRRASLQEIIRRFPEDASWAFSNPLPAEAAR